ncbi:hypothetical protein [Devosia sp. FKR38]|uniref:hypothetical protein n=1 Tax=Devosia sp. FKR38 TaxID=2562312 RepID=UPI0010C06DBA|nr:hypothetical protein [Devosia sp. FKR38]
MSGKLKIGRGAVVTACDLLGFLKTNAELESILLEYGLDEHIRPSGSREKTALAVKQFAVKNPDLEVHSDYGWKELRQLLVDEAIRRVQWDSQTASLWEKLERYLNLDGYSLLTQAPEGWSDYPKPTGVTASMPQYAELQESASELEQLLDRYQMSTAARHLKSARENLAQGDLEAANGQCRTFLEALTDSIADGLFAAESAGRSSGLQKRQLLAERGFLLKEKHEFGDGPSQTYLPGLAKLLHTDGSHPGITTPHDALFRLQIVVVTARWLLKRLEQQYPGRAP